MKLGRYAAATDPGRKRRQNEDAFVCRPPLFAIADGMGGAQAGEIASALAASALTETHVDGGGEARIRELIQEANRRVHERAANDPATSGMGTTMTAALIEPNGTVTWGHVGDSRAYVLRDGTLEQITDDHSLVAELVRRGELSPRDAEVHPQRSVITRALGTDPDVDVDSFSLNPQAGDLYLICSDGLSDMASSGTIEEVLRSNREDLDAAAKALVKAANRGGGDDNITAVLFEIVEGEAAAPDEQTREYHATAATAGDDDEDTLHPEDGVAPPPPAQPVAEAAPAAMPETPSAVDTMVVSAADIRAAVAEHQDPQAPQAGFGRRLLALLVILALVAVIVVLVWQGLAR